MSPCRSSRPGRISPTSSPMERSTPPSLFLRSPSPYRSDCAARRSRSSFRSPSVSEAIRSRLERPRQGTQGRRPQGGLCRRARGAAQRMEPKADPRLKAAHYAPVGEALVWTLDRGLGADFTSEAQRLARRLWRALRGHDRCGLRRAGRGLKAARSVRTRRAGRLLLCDAQDLVTRAISRAPEGRDLTANRLMFQETPLGTRLAPPTTAAPLQARLDRAPTTAPVKTDGGAVLIDPRANDGSSPDKGPAAWNAPGLKASSNEPRFPARWASAHTRRGVSLF